MKIRTAPTLIAAAIALSAGNASAVLDYQELGFYASNGPTGSVFFDLGVTMSEFTPAFASTPGLTVTWDLVDGTVTSNTPGDTVFSYGATWTGFAFGSTSIWGVIAPDEIIGDLFSTSAAPQSALSNTSSENAFLAADAVSSVYYNALGSTGTHASSANGASTSTGLGQDVHFNGFGGEDQWRNQTPFKAGLVGAGSMPFYKFAYDVDPGPALQTTFAGTWTLNATEGTLTYSVAAIPEPSTYALMGLGLLGIVAVARRRKI